MWVSDWVSSLLKARQHNNSYSVPFTFNLNILTTRMWANAQRDGRPAEHRRRPLFNAAMFGWRPLLESRAVTLPRHESRWNLQGCPKLANRSQPLVGRSSPLCALSTKKTRISGIRQPQLLSGISCETTFSRAHVAIIHSVGLNVTRDRWRQCVITVARDRVSDSERLFYFGRVIYLWSPYGIGQAIIFLSCGFFFYLITVARDRDSDSERLFYFGRVSFMVALCNRETIYIFILFLSSSFFFLA